MKLIADRGFAEIFPENTQTAFQNAPEHADMIEFDLRRCRSGEIVVIHDGILDAVTDASGRVDSFSATELANLNALKSGQGPPTLDSVLDTIPSSVGLNLELKEYGLAEDVVKAIRDREAHIVISSANKEILREVRVVDPDIPTALIFAINPEKNLKTAEELGCTHIQPHWVICLSTGLIERAHKKKMKTFVWTINTDVGAQILRKSGADGVIADRPVSVGQLSSYSSQEGTKFDHYSVQKIGISLLPIALSSITYPFVLVSSCLSLITQNFGTIPLNATDSGRAGRLITQSSSTVKRKLSVLLWKGKAVAIRSDGQWRGVLYLTSVRRFYSSIFSRGTVPIQFTGSEPATKVNKLWNKAQNGVLSVYAAVTDKLHNVSLSRSTVIGWWRQ
ncbi:glycerophosphodiester phosphodiesterase [Halosolutus gelatinilyticus]|uniref:glycerophosphodiester phosphodiesterase n=1 Tax=Halosolutus gelatinilyticus TaxID=2931975 RepID=UPI001FF576AC|nr:glycerophosphodiester phosphodiesterase [Halosolutus gelatinilyticus]